MRLYDSLNVVAAAKPEMDFAIQGVRRLSYQQAAAETNRLAHALIGAGLQCGDRIAILARNSIEYALFLFAASKAEVVLVPLNWRLAPPEWSFILNDAEARVLIASKEYVAPIDAMRAELDKVRQFVCIDSDASPGWTHLHSWVSGQPASDAPRHTSTNPDAVQVYTSGTTGKPKGVVLTQQNLASAFEACAPLLAGEAGERRLLVLPMFHIFGANITFIAPLTESTLFVMPEFQADAVLRAIREERIAVAYLVPAMIQACLNHPDAARGGYQALRLITYAASPIAETTLRKAAEVFQCEFAQFYGMTEIVPLTALLPADHHRALAGQPGLLLSAGRTINGTELRIVDLHDQVVAPGIVGEIVARSPAMMAEYWKRPEATAETLRGGWMHTGDMGYMDREGFVYILDRVKDMIVSGGENIYPREVEEVLTQMPAIADAAVIGVPDTVRGETVKAIVVLHVGATTTEQQILDFCRGRLGGYKLPRSVDFIDQLPRNPSGKILKRVLREPYWRGYARRVSGA